MNSALFGQPKPRTVELQMFEPPHRHRYSVYVKGGNWSEDKPVMEEWCSKMFGPHSKQFKNPRWHRDAFNFKFKKEKDAMLFVMRWG